MKENKKKKHFYLNLIFCHKHILTYTHIISKYCKFYYVRCEHIEGALTPIYCHIMKAIKFQSFGGIIIKNNKNKHKRTSFPEIYCQKKSISSIVTNKKQTLHTQSHHHLAKIDFVFFFLYFFIIFKIFQHQQQQKPKEKGYVFLTLNFAVFFLSLWCCYRKTWKRK